jgi:hypothetical protein
LKKSIALSLPIIFLLAFAAAATAAEWKLFERPPSSASGHPWSIQLMGANSSENNGNATTGFNNTLAGFKENMIPLTMGQLRLSFIDIAPATDASHPASEPHAAPMLEFHTGVQTEKFQDTLPAGTFGIETDWSASTFILFFGVNLNVGPGYFQSNAFISHPPENNAHAPTSNETFFARDMLTDTTAKGFNAAAGYKLSNRVTLEAGYGYVEHDRNQTKFGEEAWAIYAQAILNLAPGVQVIPEIGQIDFDKNQPKKATADNFYAGAKWEINF